MWRDFGWGISVAVLGFGLGVGFGEGNTGGLGRCPDSETQSFLLFGDVTHEFSFVFR